MLAAETSATSANRLPARTVIDIPTLFPAPNYLQSARMIAIVTRIKVITLDTGRRDQTRIYIDFDQCEED